MPTKKTDAVSLPYMNAYGVITKTLDKIQDASTPSRFTQDFLETKLGLKGGSPRPVIPFFKRTGFLNSDGTPTELYKEFRNEKLRGRAAARAIRQGYSALYEVNEYVHELSDKDLKGVVVQLTGLEARSTTVNGILGSFKALRAFAKFEDVAEAGAADDETADESAGTDDEKPGKKSDQSVSLKLGYTINLNLPATSDIAVFDAIFKSLKKHLLD